MELNINSPAYYTKVYGVDDEIYWLYQDIAQYFKDKEYSDIIKTVGIVPIVALEEEVKRGLWKETKKVELKYGFASLSLQMNYQEYIDADISHKKVMVINNILKSVKAIKSKAKIDFNAFEKDMRRFCEANNINIDR